MLSAKQWLLVCFRLKQLFGLVFWLVFFFFLRDIFFWCLELFFQFQCLHLRLREETERNSDYLIPPVRGLAAKQHNRDYWAGRRYFSIRKSSCSSLRSIIGAVSMAMSFAKETGEAAERLRLSMVILERLPNLQTQFELINATDAPHVLGGRSPPPVCQH